MKRYWVDGEEKGKPLFHNLKENAQKDDKRGKQKRTFSLHLEKRDMIIQDGQKIERKKDYKIRKIREIRLTLKKKYIIISAFLDKETSI